MTGRTRQVNSGRINGNSYTGALRTAAAETEIGRSGGIQGVTIPAPLPRTNAERFGTYCSKEKDAESNTEKRSGSIWDRLIRVATVPMLMAFILLTILRFLKGMFPGAAYPVGVFCLSVFPLLSYLLWYVVPPLRKKGRKTQRLIACGFSFLGYAAGTVYCFAAHLGISEKIVFLTYLFSGLTIAVASIFKFKISGHSCGVSGPIATLVWLVSPLYLLAYALLAGVFVSSVRLRRHTVRELVLGTVLPVVIMLVLIAICRGLSLL